jgi:hypothetical protein
MKFFTFSWWCGEYEEADADAVAGKYRDHFASIEDRLPASILDFARHHSLHDARLEKFSLNVVDQAAELHVRGWDPKCEEKRAYSLFYSVVSGVLSQGSPEEPLGGPGGFGDLGYDEFDLLEDDKIEHRMLFSTGIELSVAFSDFRFAYHAIREPLST